MELARDNWTWKSYGAIGGLLCGLSAPILGSLFTIVSWFSDPSWHGLHLRSAGTVMFAVAIPLMAVGAHCLDLIEKEKKRIN
jgi:hypothetical protein